MVTAALAASAADPHPHRSQFRCHRLRHLDSPARSKTAAARLRPRGTGASEQPRRSPDGPGVLHDAPRPPRTRWSPDGVPELCPHRAPGAVPVPAPPVLSREIPGRSRTRSSLSPSLPCSLSSAPPRRRRSRRPVIVRARARGAARGDPPRRPYKREGAGRCSRVLSAAPPPRPGESDLPGEPRRTGHRHQVLAPGAEPRYRVPASDAEHRQRVPGNVYRHRALNTGPGEHRHRISSTDSRAPGTGYRARTAEQRHRAPRSSHPTPHPGIEPGPPGTAFPPPRHRLQPRAGPVAGPATIAGPVAGACPVAGPAAVPPVAPPRRLPSPPAPRVRKHAWM
ncbi:serine/arginine repetitive matrix protein 1-like [Phaenicophaeus curvirostris]|uniref:serine/arginine repetitive matrix protein 1-like n=1 Tax=Phaenicophaeus curvirostris TaxID=33595 RepID=UPI0037F0C8F0